jgi:hypothetical protein
MSLSSGDNPKAGTLTATTTPQALGSQSCSAVLLQCDPGAASNLLVGDAASQPFGLKAGQALTLPCANLSQVYVATASGTALANFISVS